jgi:hypothetical protein
MLSYAVVRPTPLFLSRLLPPWNIVSGPAITGAYRRGSGGKSRGGSQEVGNESWTKWGNGLAALNIYWA